MSAPPVAESSKVVHPCYTRDPYRIYILQRNLDEGMARERAPLNDRIQWDKDATIVTPNKLAMLRLAAGLDRPSL